MLRAHDLSNRKTRKILKIKNYCLKERFTRTIDDQSIKFPREKYQNRETEKLYNTTRSLQTFVYTHLTKNHSNLQKSNENHKLIVLATLVISFLVLFILLRNRKIRKTVQPQFGIETMLVIITAVLVERRVTILINLALAKLQQQRRVWIKRASKHRLDKHLELGTGILFRATQRNGTQRRELYDSVMFQLTWHDMYMSG